MKLFISLFLIALCSSSAFGQETEETPEQKIYLLCDPSVEEMVLYVIDGEYFIAEKKEQIMDKIGTHNMYLFGLIDSGEDFEREIAKTPYADKNSYLIVIELVKGVSNPLKTEEAEENVYLLCDPSVEDMALYIVDGEYYIAENKEQIVPKFTNSIETITLVEKGEWFEKEVAKIAYGDKIRKIVVIELKEGASNPLKTEEEKE